MSDDESTPPNPKILYLFDDQAKLPEVWPQSSHVFIVPITSAFRKVDSVVATVEGRSDSRATILNYVERFNATAFSIRDKYLEMMAQFPRRPIFKGLSIHEKFLTSRGGSSLWWLTPIAEKNTIATDSFARLAALLTIIDLLSEVGSTEIWVDLADTQLVRALKANKPLLGHIKEMRQVRSPRPAGEVARAAFGGSKQVGKYLAKMLMARWAMRGTDPVGHLNGAEFVPVTYFPVFDEGAWAEKRFANKYFPSFQTELEEKYGSKIAWLMVYARFGNQGWRQSLAMGRQANDWGYHLSFLEQWLYFRDLFSATKNAAEVAYRFARSRTTVEKEFVWHRQDATLHIWPLFDRDWYDSFCGAGLVRGLVHERIFKRVSAHLAPKAKIIYVAEMLAWEKALSLATAVRKDVTTIGIQHTIVPLLLLNYFNDPIDMDEEQTDFGMPRPDYLACVGETTRRLMLDTGWEKERAFVWGAVRFKHFQRQLANCLPWIDRDNKVIVALPISPDQSKEILGFVHRAFADKSGYEVIIKGHPACPVKPVISALNLDFSEPRWHVSERPLSELLPSAKAAVVTQSSAALESIACQCPVIIPLLAQAVDMNPLSGTCDLPTHVYDPREMREVVNRLMQESSDAPLPFDKCEEFIHNYCYFPEKGEALRRVENF